MCAWFYYLSAGPPGLICVTVKALDLCGVLWYPPRKVKPNPPLSLSNVTVCCVQQTENELEKAEKRAKDQNVNSS